jgi:hypothetical protein
MMHSSTIHRFLEENASLVAVLMSVVLPEIIMSLMWTNKRKDLGSS